MVYSFAKIAVVTLNVLGGPLKSCSTSPMTGLYRDGFCRTDEHDKGVHVVCAEVDDRFLQFSKARGNDLTTPSLPGFPGLKAGDKWCLCAMRWQEAKIAGFAPKVDLEATNKAVLNFTSLNLLAEEAINDLQ